MNHFKLGRMGATEGAMLLILTLEGRVMLAAVPEAVNQGAALAWLIYLIAGVSAFLAGASLVLLQNKFSGDLLHACQTLLGKPGFYLVGGLYALMFMTNGALLLRQFASSNWQFGLATIPIQVIVFIYAVLAGLSIYFGLEALARAAYVLFPAMLAWLLFIYVSITSSYNIYNLFPWEGLGLAQAAKQGLLWSGTNVSIVLIAILAPAFQDLRTKLQCVFWGAAISTGLKIIFVLVFLLTIGVEVGREKIIAFFDVASLVYFDKSFQHIEDFTTLIWTFLGVGAVGLNMYVFLYLLLRMFSLPTIRPLVPSAGVLFFALAVLPYNIMDLLNLDFLIFKTFFNLGIYLIPALLWAAFLVRRKKPRISTTPASEENF